MYFHNFSLCPYPISLYSFHFSPQHAYHFKMMCNHNGFETFSGLRDKADKIHHGRAFKPSITNSQFCGYLKIRRLKLTRHRVKIFWLQQSWCNMFKKSATSFHNSLRISTCNTKGGVRQQRITWRYQAFYTFSSLPICPLSGLYILPLTTSETIQRFY
jgi:hypothetical protein